jgi:hypothetical protein
MLDEDCPEAVVQRQLDAYNARDVEAWLATYAEDACQYEHPGKLLARGHAEMRERIAARFQEPDLQATLMRRVVLGPLVIDQELVRRNFPQGIGSMEMVAIYDVRDGLIRSGSFVCGQSIVG